ncbi:MAG: AAA family ATPase [Bacilli bacterium]|nr:AAA family ATPase [Bacilli bacterium]
MDIQYKEERTSFIRFDVKDGTFKKSEDENAASNSWPRTFSYEQEPHMAIFLFPSLGKQATSNLINRFIVNNYSKIELKIDESIATNSVSDLSLINFDLDACKRLFRKSKNIKALTFRTDGIMTSAIVESEKYVCHIALTYVESKSCYQGVIDWIETCEKAYITFEHKNLLVGVSYVQGDWKHAYELRATYLINNIDNLLPSEEAILEEDATKDQDIDQVENYVDAADEGQADDVADIVVESAVSDSGLFENKLQELNQDANVIDEDDIEDDSSEEEDVTVLPIGTKIYREVFIYQKFHETFKNVRSSLPAGKNYEDIRDELVNRFSTKNDEDLRNYISSRHVFIIDRDGDMDIYRCRTLGGRKSMVRVLFCFGKELKGRSNEINDDSVVLLSLLGPTDHSEENFVVAANKLEGELYFASGDEFKKADYKIGNSALISRAHRRRDNTIYEEWVLDEKQQEIFDNCQQRPPFFVIGNAGTGKSLIAEKLYESIHRANPKLDILYATYMDALKGYVSSHLTYRDIDEEDIKCHTFKDIIFKYLKDAETNYKDEKEFAYWITNNSVWLKQQSINIDTIFLDKDYTLDIAYMFYRSFSSLGTSVTFEECCKDGSLAQEGDDSVESVFFKVAAEEKLTDKQSRDLYKICSKYHEYLRAKNYYNDNEAALRIISLVGLRRELDDYRSAFSKNWRKKFLDDRRNDLNRLNYNVEDLLDIPLFDVVIVDEIQDLTLPQIRALMTILKGEPKNRQFVAFGDENQTINPTLVKMRNVCSEINNHFDAQMDFNDIYLNLSYRGTGQINDYVNYLSEIRRKTIGRNKANYELPRKIAGDKFGDKESENKVSFIYNKEIAEYVLKNPSLFSDYDIRIITPTSRLADELISANKAGLQDASRGEDNIIYKAISVDESKGREWETVILYDFFSSSEEIWKKFADKTRNNVDSSESESFRSVIKRRYFNRLYVALTRASENVIIIEDKELNKDVVDVFIPKNKNFRIKNIVEREGITEVLGAAYDHSKWYELAQKSFELKDYLSASERALNAIRALLSDDVNNDELYGKYDLLQKRSELKILLETKKGFDKSRFKDYIDEIEQYGDIRDLATLYELMGYRDRHKMLTLKVSTSSREIVDLYNKAKKNMDQKEQNMCAPTLIEAYKQILLNSEEN